MLDQLRIPQLIFFFKFSTLFHFKKLVTVPSLGTYIMSHKWSSVLYHTLGCRHWNNCFNQPTIPISWLSFKIIICISLLVTYLQNCFKIKCQSIPEGELSTGGSSYQSPSLWSPLKFKSKEKVTRHFRNWIIMHDF